VCLFSGSDGYIYSKRESINPFFFFLSTIFLEMIDIQNLMTIAREPCDLPSSSVVVSMLLRNCTPIMLQDRRDPVKIVGNKKTIQIKISGVRVE
jgi:hypothetical protein